MRLIYSPEGGEAQEWDFIPGKMMSVEAEALEKATGWTYIEFGEKFMAGSTLARRALLWVMRRRTERGLKFSDVKFALDELDVDFSRDERVKLRQALLDSPDIDEAQREQILAELGDEDDDEADAAPKSPAALPLRESATA